MVNWVREEGRSTGKCFFTVFASLAYAFHSDGHPRPPLFPIYPIICIGSCKDPIFQEILLYYL